MTRHYGEVVLVDHDSDVFNWFANENPLPMRNQKTCKSTRCFHLSNPTITICSFLLLFTVVSLTIYFGLRQHMNGPGIVWQEVMANVSTNVTTEVHLPYHVSYHSWHYNTLILRVWMGTCLAVGLFIAFTLILLVCNFFWKKHKQTSKEQGNLRKTDFEENDTMELKQGTVFSAYPSETDSQRE